MAEAQTSHPRRLVLDAGLRALGVEPVRRGRWLSSSDIGRRFKEHGAIHIWVTDYCSGIVRQFSQPDSLEFWLQELRSRLYSETDGFTELSQADRRAYVAQEWQSPYDVPLIEARRFDVR